MELATGVTATSYIQTTDIVTGSTYVFKAQARNEVGYSEDSPTVTILAASVPSVTAAPTTEIINPEVNPDVVVTWTVTPNGSAITSYKVLIRKSDDTYET